MDKIKSFEEFTLNEKGSALNLLGSVLTGNTSASQLISLLGGSSGMSGRTPTGQTTTIGTPGSTPSGSTSGTYTATPGNDDFALYMQHQQGIAGASGLVKALNGTGKMHPDTIKTKGGIKYANLVQNVPSDRPKYKKDIIASLDRGDQKTAAGLFLNMWKEKWVSRQKKARTDINIPKNSVVKDAITKASTKYKVPFDFAITVAHIESGLNPKAGNSTYKGLFAMQPGSNYGGTVTPMGNKWADPYVNAENGVKLLKNNITQFKRILGNDWLSLKVGSWANNLA
ncbi:MAG: hypothetical protein EXR20_05375 [Bacteroidetes bacterium]|nr:hypothetical protein [Bacteroidota bacterium]